MAEAPKPPRPPVVAPPVVAPPSADVPTFEFEGGKAVNSESDPVQLYKGYMEYTLRSKWNRPENMADDNYVAEVAVNRLLMARTSTATARPSWWQCASPKPVMLKSTAILRTLC